MAPPCALSPYAELSKNFSVVPATCKPNFFVPVSSMTLSGYFVVVDEPSAFSFAEEIKIAPPLAVATSETARLLSKLVVPVPEISSNPEAKIAPPAAESFVVVESVPVISLPTATFPLKTTSPPAESPVSFTTSVIFAETSAPPFARYFVEPSATRRRFSTVVPAPSVRYVEIVFVFAVANARPVFLVSSVVPVSVRFSTESVTPLRKKRSPEPAMSKSISEEEIVFPLPRIVT